jgi:two-component system NtrC family sensor kinase
VRELKSQLGGALLMILTAAAVIAAGISFQQQRKFHLPEDGVTWVDRTNAEGRPVVVALHVAANSPAAKAGIKEGDVLRKINAFGIAESIDATRVLASVGAWKKAEYVLERNGIELTANVIIRESETRGSLTYQYLAGLAYLVIGLFVYFRRGSAPMATHFYILCLASFIYTTFHYTGKLNNFDKVIYWGNVVGGLFAPTIFLHFALNFSPRWGVLWRRWWAGLLLYLPAAAFSATWVGFASGILRANVSLIELRWLLDKGWLLFLSAGYLLGGAVLALSTRQTSDAIVRQQLKWLRNGALFGVLPFCLFYVTPYLFGYLPGPYMQMSVLSMLLIPMTWAYAILRYRLMDVDLIFQQGYAHTLATLAVLGVIYGLIFSIGRVEELDPAAVVLLILIATFIFQPLRNWIQEVLSRYYFYKDRYDYRRTLIEFARELSSETNLERMLSLVAERLKRTLSIRRVAFFLNRGALGDETGGEGFSLFMDSEGLISPYEPLDLSFLKADANRPIFFESTRHQFDVVSQHLPPTVRQTLARLDLNYYLPCSARGRTIAFLGVSRTNEGDFLSSEDIELLTTLSNYVAIAIENARLYQSLQQKVLQYERLKEYSENIVESINVGIVAADFEDRVESWNSQMEALTGIGREQALGKKLSELFPGTLAATFEQMRGESGVHHIYKHELRREAAAAAVVNSNGATNGDRAVQTATHAVVNIAIAPLMTKEGRQIGRLIIFDDITERLELEKKLIQSDKLSSIGLLAAGVAHEVNTPLAVISTYAQMLAKQVSDDEQKSKLLEKIAKQTFRASEIVNSLLNFSRTSQSAFEEVDLNKVLRETLSLIQPQLSKGGIRIEFEAGADLPPVRGNAGKMQQVFLNLFLNARDAMENGGVLSISSEAREGMVHVEVADTGKGIPPEDLPKIYDPFFTTKAARKGTGLGLAVTYGIVREHGGTIEVDSRVGAGTRFRLEFPAVRKTIHA